MDSLSDYQIKVFSIISSIQHNLFTDYEGQITNQNIEHIINLYKNCYQEKNPQQREIIYKKLKSNIQNQNQLTILHWIEKQRAQKYLNETLPSANIKKDYHSIKVCLNSDSLQQTRVIKFFKKLPVLQSSTLYPVQISQSQFMMQKELNHNKMCLFRKVRQREQKPTPWIVQKTKDHRYVWRASCGIDRKDVYNLLTFILLKRSEDDDICPSIFINTGSHGDITGRTSGDAADFRLTAQFIYEETLDTLRQIIENHGSKLRLNYTNITKKICLYFLNSSCPSVYPDQADHIIDTQCFGAFSSIKAHRLHPPETLIQEQDLMFLEGKLEIQILKYMSSQKKFSLKKDKNEQYIPYKVNTNISKILSQSSIIKSQKQANTLINFFNFTSKNSKIQKKLRDLNILFRASQHGFSISEYFNICGQQANTLFLCLSEKNKIIGAYSPLVHYKEWSWIELIGLQGQWVRDIEKQSFIFSVTNNQKFELCMPQNAIYRKLDQSSIVFGCYDFSICDEANVTRQSKAVNNWAYYNFNYKPPNQQQICIENCIRFNGNQNPFFLIKEWQVWKVQFQQNLNKFY